MIARCPLCMSELVELGPDAVCTSGHWLRRDPDTGELRPSEQSTDQGAPEPEEDRTRETQASRLVRLALASGVELWHTPDGEAWATLPAGDHREHWPLTSRAVRDWLQHQYYRHYERLAHTQAMQDALSALAGRARFEGAEHPVYVRVAEHDGAIYLDLADPQWRAVEITADGWRVVTDPPVRFRRARGMQPLPEPQRGGSLDLLWRYVNVTEADRPLVKGWAAMTLAPHGPYPVLALGGEQGSGKSTTARVLRRLVDPNEADLRSEPREVRDLAIAARNGWVVAIDNASRLPQWLSDALCRLSTGAGFATRELYSDHDEIIMQAQRPVIITSITDVVTSPDLLDRALVVTCPTLPDDQREPEEAFWRRFEADRPLILGALCDLASRALRELPQVRLERYPRMADFARWAVAALGMESGVLERYQDNRRTAISTAIEASPVAEAVLAYMVGRETWEGTASELLAELDAAADDETRRRRERLKSWPKTARGLAGEFRRLAPALRAQGLVVTFSRRGHGGTRRISMWLTDRSGDDGGGGAGTTAGDHRRIPSEQRETPPPPEQRRAQPSPSSPSPPPPQDADTDADLSGDGRVTVGDGGDADRHRDRHRDFPHADGENQQRVTVGDGGDGRLHLYSNGVDQRLLETLCQRGRAPVWELAWGVGLSDTEAVAAAQRLLDAGLIQRVGDDLRAPLGVWSEVALAREVRR